MILKFAFIFICGLSTCSALAAETSPILGKWQYDGFIYEGNRFPNPNPELELTFTFSADGTDRLFWSRKNEVGFCERIANFEVVDDHLKQTIVWVNPNNRSECAQDSDMQLGRETDSEFSIQGVELQIKFDLSGKPLIYILKFIDPNSPVP